MADIPGKQVFGTAQTVIDTAVDVAAGTFSLPPAATFINNDAAVPNATHAQVMLEAPGWAAAPAAGSLVELWGMLVDTDGIEDDTDVPGGSSPGGARYMGEFRMAAANAAQRRTITIRLLGVIKMDFYIRNGTAQNMNNDSGTNCVVKVTPFSIGVAA